MRAIQKEVEESRGVLVVWMDAACGMPDVAAGTGNLRARTIVRLHQILVSSFRFVSNAGSEPSTSKADLFSAVTLA